MGDLRHLWPYPGYALASLISMPRLKDMPEHVQMRRALINSPSDSGVTADSPSTVVHSNTRISKFLQQGILRRRLKISTPTCIPNQVRNPRYFIPIHFTQHGACILRLAALLHLPKVSTNGRPQPRYIRITRTLNPYGWLVEGCRWPSGSQS